MNRQDAKSARVEPDSRVDGLARAVIGAAIEVHRILGPGYLESVYEEALALEFSLRQISFARQKSVSVVYKGHSVGESRLGLLVRGCRIGVVMAVYDVSPALR